MPMVFRGIGENGSSGGGNDTSVGEKLLSTLLTEMDGLELAQVFYLIVYEELMFALGIPVTFFILDC